MAADYDTLVYTEVGGSKMVVADGGEIEIQSGGTLDILSGANFNVGTFGASMVVTQDDNYPVGIFGNITTAQTTGSVTQRALWARMDVDANLSGTSSVMGAELQFRFDGATSIGSGVEAEQYTGAWLYFEQDTSGDTLADYCHASASFASVETHSDLGLSANTHLSGIEIASRLGASDGVAWADTTGTTAALFITKAPAATGVTASNWPYGIVIENTTTAIDIGSCTRGIDFTGTEGSGSGEANICMDVGRGADFSLGIYLYGSTDKSIYVAQYMSAADTKPVEFYGMPTSTTAESSQGVLQINITRDSAYAMSTTTGNPDTVLRLRGKNEANNTTSNAGLRGIDLEVVNSEASSINSYLHAATFTAENTSEINTQCDDMQVLQLIMSNQGIVDTSLYGLRVLENSEGTIPTDTVGIRVTTSTNAPAAGTRADGMMITTGGATGGWTDGLHIAGTITNAINISGTTIGTGIVIAACTTGINVTGATTDAIIISGTPTTSDITFHNGATIMNTSGVLTIVEDLITITGNLQVDGTTTTINTATWTVDDPNIQLGLGTSPTDITADGGGITLVGDTNKTIIWDDTNNNWTFNQSVNLSSGLVYKIDNVEHLSASTLTFANGCTINNWHADVVRITEANIDMYGNLRIGTGGAGYDVEFNNVGAAGVKIALWDASERALIFATDTFLRFGPSSQVDMTYNGSNFTVASSVVWNFGTNTNGHDVRFYTDVDGQALEWDASAAMLILDDVDMRVETGSLLYFGTASGEVAMTYNGVNFNIQTTKVWNFGSSGTGMDVQFMSDAANSVMYWDASDNQLEFENAGIVMVGDPASTTCIALSGTYVTGISMAGTITDGVLISGTVSDCGLEITGTCTDSAVQIATGTSAIGVDISQACTTAAIKTSGDQVVHILGEVTENATHFIDIDVPDAKTCTTGIELGVTSTGTYTTGISIADSTTGIYFADVGAEGRHLVDVIDGYLGLVIETGSYGDTATAVKLTSTNTRPASFLFDDGGANIGGGADVRAVLSRIAVIAEQTGSSITAMRGQCKLIDNVDFDAYHLVGVEGYIELEGLNDITLETDGSAVACFRGRLEVNQNITHATANTYLTAFFADLKVASTMAITQTNGVLAGVVIDASNVSGAAAAVDYWGHGIYIADDATDIGITVGACATGISFGNVPAGIDFTDVGSTGEHLIHVVDAYTGSVIETGTYGGASTGVTLAVGNLRPVSFLFDDAGAALGYGSYKPVVSRVKLTASITAQVAVRSFQGMLSVDNAVDLDVTSGFWDIVGGVEGYIQLLGDHTVGALTRLACQHATLQASGAVTVTSGGMVCGYLAQLAGKHATVSFDSPWPVAFCADRLDPLHVTEQEPWNIGLYIPDDGCTTGINIGACTTGIDLTGDMTTGINVAAGCTPTDVIKIQSTACTRGIFITGGCMDSIKIEGSTTTRRGFFYKQDLGTRHADASDDNSWGAYFHQTHGLDAATAHLIGVASYLMNDTGDAFQVVNFEGDCMASSGANRYAGAVLHSVITAAPSASGVAWGDTGLRYVGMIVYQGPTTDQEGDAAIAIDDDWNAGIWMDPSELTHAFKFQAASGCMEVNAAEVAGTATSHALRIDIAGTDHWIPVYSTKSW